MSVSYKDFLIKSHFNNKKANHYRKCYNEILERGLFDNHYYLTAYPSVAQAGMDPLFHYLFYGYKEGKLPSLSFDLDGYLEKNPEITQNNLNPLVHFLDNGEDSFILSHDPVEMKKNRIIKTNSLFLSDKLENGPLVSIIILNRNGLHHLKRLFKDFNEKTNYSNYEIIVVDNASNDGSVEYLKSLDLPIAVIENKNNVSFSKGNNDAAKIAKGEYILLLNNDIEPTFGWLNELMVSMFSNDNVAAVGSKLIFPYYSQIDQQSKSFSIQHAGVIFDEERTVYLYGPQHENMYLTLIFSDKVNNEKEVISNTAACLLIPKDIYFELSGLDEKYFYGYEDIDFAFKALEKGYKSIYCPKSLLFHHESATRKQDDRTLELNYKNIMYFKSKWEDKLQKAMLLDKIYNCHFINKNELSFLFINNNESNNDFINNVSKLLNEKGYSITLSEDMENRAIPEHIDILISFTKEYNVKNLFSRHDLIKILVSNIKEDDYDMVLDIDKNPLEFVEKLMKNIEDYYV